MFPVVSVAARLKGSVRAQTMHGPETTGHWSKRKGTIVAPYRHLVPGKRYTVAETFLDAQRHVHRPGECWSFLGHTSVGAAESIILFVSFDGQREWAIPIEYSSADSLQNFIAEASEQNAL